MTEIKFKRIQCLDRALDILAAINGAELKTINEIASKVKLNPSTAYNIVKTLESRGFVSCENGNYEIGSKLGLMASGWDIVKNLPVLSKPILEEVRDKTGEGVCVTILSGKQAEIVTLMPGTRQVAVQFLHRTWNYPLNLGTGRLLVALGDPADWPQHINKHLKEGPKNLGEREWDFEKWQACLEELRAQDFVSIHISPGDGEEAIGAVALPLRNAAGRLIAAVASSCPMNRATKEHMRFIKETIAAAIKNNPL